MESKPHWIAFDWFKLITAILLLILFILLILRPNQVGPVDTVSLPAYPQVAYLLNYDEASQTLLDANGTPQFSLSADGKGWQPFIPESLKATLPAGYSVLKISETFWEIRDASGSMLYSWGMDTFKWKPPAVEHPDLPADVQAALPAGAAFQQNAEGAWVILNQAGRLLYTWDAQAETWVPAIPGALTEQLPAGYATVQGVNGGWMIVGADGVALYIWDVEAVAWGMAGPQIPADLVARLPEGARRVQKANLRWAIQDSAGKDLYTWDTQVMAWVQVVPEFLPGTTPAMQTLSPEPTGMPVP